MPCPGKNLKKHGFQTGWENERFLVSSVFFSGFFVKTYTLKKWRLMSLSQNKEFSAQAVKLVQDAFELVDKEIASSVAGRMAASQNAIFGKGSPEFSRLQKALDRHIKIIENLQKDSSFKLRYLFSTAHVSALDTTGRLSCFTSS